jgi:hypothetical protein
MLRAMELILALLGAGPIGFFSPTRRRALTIYLCLWAAVFPVQTLVAAGGAEICTGDSGSPSLLAGTDLVLGITSVEWSLAGAECESGPWEQRVDTPAARAFLSHYVPLP